MPIEESPNRNGNLSRRGFVKSSLLASLTTAVLPAFGFAEKKVASLTPQIDSSSFELEEKSIGELAEGMASGKYIARSIAEKYLSRIEFLTGNPNTPKCDRVES